jgi:hypothetical protein
MLGLFFFTIPNPNLDKRVIGLYLPTTFALGGWFTAVVLLVFVLIGRSVALRQSGSGHLRSQDVVVVRD